MLRRKKLVRPREAKLKVIHQLSNYNSQAADLASQLRKLQKKISTPHFSELIRQCIESYNILLDNNSVELAQNRLKSSLNVLVDPNDHSIWLLEYLTDLVTMMKGIIANVGDL